MGGAGALQGTGTAGHSGPVTIATASAIGAPTLADMLTFDSPVTGPGSLSKVGLGVVELWGNNSYAGGTTIESGTLRLLSGASLPGGGAEILVDEVRRKVSPKKIMTDDWLHVMECAHSIGMESTATMVIGLGETMEERMEHMERIRDLQDETGGFRAFIMWTFQPGHTELAAHGAAAEKVSSWDYMRTLAVARLFFDNIAHIQGSWVTQGERVGQLTLGFGADDAGSIMLEENVVRAAGTRYEMSTRKMVELIRGAGREPAQRDTEYRVLKRF